MDQATEEQADVTDHEYQKSRQKDRGNAPTFFTAAARRMSQDGSSHHCDHQQSKQQSHQANVESHIAVQNVTELVSDDPLELITAQFRDCAPCDTDCGIGRVLPSRKGVDAELLLQQVDLRHWNAGGNRHLLDDIEQPALLRIACVS